MIPGTYTLSSIINEDNINKATDLEFPQTSSNPMYVPPLGELTDSNYQVVECVNNKYFN